MLTLRVHGTLSLAEQAGGGPAFLSAASGLVQTDTQWIVVADDEHHLAVFDRRTAMPGRRVRLFEGDLPADPKARKARKPDLESLTQLPEHPGYPRGALMAFGSGSTTQRHRAAIVPADTPGRPQVVDLTALYAPLHAQFTLLNIEGAFVSQDQLCLLQRANKGDSRNACIRWPLDRFLVWLADEASGRASPPPEVAAIDMIDIGQVDGVPLSFTDGCALPDGGWLFSAVAEDTFDNYLDGACVAAAVGWVDVSGRLRAVERLAFPWKVEGLAAEIQEAGFALTLVTDADDPATPAQVLVGEWVPDDRFDQTER